MELLPTVVAAVIFAAEFLRVRAWWFIPGRGTYGYPQNMAQRVLDGTARAPDQYRPLAPHLGRLVAAVLGQPFPTGMLVVDLLATLGMLAALHLLCARLGAPQLIIVAALGWTFWASKLDHWDAQVAPLAFTVTVAILVLASPQRWWSGPMVVALGAVMLGLRTDYAAGFGVIAVAVAIQRRSWRLALAGVAVLAAAPIVTRVLLSAFPQARYESAVVQLDYNLTLGALLQVAAFYGLVLMLPLAAAVRWRALPPLWFAPTWFAAQLAVTYVVGRPDETRIFLPLAPALALAAAVAYFELRRAAESPVVADVSGEPTAPLAARRPRTNVFG